MSDNSLYVRKSPSFSAKLFAESPEAISAYSQYNKAIFVDSHLTVREKELIAVGITHITGCPYCIEGHTGKAKAEKITLDELAEVIAVTAAIQAYTTFYHGINVLHAFKTPFIEDSDLYDVNSIEKVNEFETLVPDAFDAFNIFVYQSLKANQLSSREKLLIALGSTLAVGDAYSIDVYTRKAKESGINLNELAEVVLVTSALTAGAVVAHRVNLIRAYERE